MTYINPITSEKRNLNAFGRFNYPEDYKEIIHITKFERDTLLEGSRGRGDSGTDASGLDFDDENAFNQGLTTIKEAETKLLSYEFVNCWPTNMTSMRVAYGQSNVLRCSVQLAYDRYFTNYNYEQTNNAATESFYEQLDDDEKAARYNQKRKLNNYEFAFAEDQIKSGKVLEKKNFSNMLSDS